MKLLSYSLFVAGLLTSVEARRGGQETVHRFKPCPRPEGDTQNRKNLVPKKEVHLSYDSAEDDSPGSIDMKLLLNNPAVVLEDVEDISGAACSDGSVTVSFSNREALEEALGDWTEDKAFILITNHLGNCDSKFERGFFLANGLESNFEDLTITVNAAKQGLEQIATDLEMSFASLPGATLSRRVTLDPSISITISEGLDPNTVLYTDGTYFTLTANEAEFTTTVTFSGYLHYNFLIWKLEQLYFDIDASFDADLTVSADVLAPYTNTFKYSPGSLSYDFVSVPGIVKLGPGLDFGIGANLDVSAAVGVTSAVGVSIPNGNVHLDFLDSAKTGTSNWEPQYSATANITERAQVGLDVYIDLTLELAFELLGGLVDLSAGITATPGFDNKFTLLGSQGASVEGREVEQETTVFVVRDVAPVLEPRQELACAETNGVQLVTDFYFKLTAFATQWWNQELYSVVVPLLDYCYAW